MCVARLERESQALCVESRPLLEQRAWGVRSLVTPRGRPTEAVKEQARGSVNKDALLWAAARASVQLTWFLSSLLSGSSIGDKASSLASICIYSSIRCMRSYFGGGIPHKLSFLCTALALDLLCVRID